MAIDSLRAADDSCTAEAAEPGQPWDPSPTNLNASPALLFKKFREDLLLTGHSLATGERDMQ